MGDCMLLFTCLVMSDSLWPPSLQHARLPCPSPSPRVCSNSCPLNWWCHPTISSFHFLPSPFPPVSIFPSIRVFSNESALGVRWPDDWSFSCSISPSNEYSGLISFKIDWFDLLAVQGILKSLLQYKNLSKLWAQVPNTARQAASLPGDISRGRRSSMPQPKTCMLRRISRQKR